MKRAFYYAVCSFIVHLKLILTASQQMHLQLILMHKVALQFYRLFYLFRGAVHINFYGCNLSRQHLWNTKRKARGVAGELGGCGWLLMCWRIPGSCPYANSRHAFPTLFVMRATHPALINFFACRQRGGTCFCNNFTR